MELFDEALAAEHQCGMQTDAVVKMLAGLSPQWINMFGKDLRLYLSAAIGGLTYHKTSHLWPPPGEVMAEFRRVKLAEIRSIIITDGELAATMLLRHDTIVIKLSLVAARIPGISQLVSVPAWESFTREVVAAILREVAPTRARVIMLGDAAIAAIGDTLVRSNAATIAIPSAALPQPFNVHTVDAMLRERGQTSIVRFSNNAIDTSLLSIDSVIATFDAAPKPIYVFTDGGCIGGNGSARAVASWGFTVMRRDCTIIHEASGLVPLAYIPGKKYQTSNQRGELLAMSAALKWLGGSSNDNSSRNSKDEITNIERPPVTIYSDSKYTISCITDWGPKWIRQNKTDDKANLDIILPAIETHGMLQQQRFIEIKHVKAHRNEPADKTSDDWFQWYGNDRADKLCNIALSRP